MKKSILVPLTALLIGAFLLAACQTAAPTAAPGAPGAIAQPTAVPAEASPTAKSVQPAAPRDVNAMDACALFPGDKLATALNTTLADPTNLGAGIAAQCTYFLLPAAGGAGELYNLFLSPAKLYAPTLNGLVNPQPVTGLGDKATIGTLTGSTSTYDVVVLKTGDLMLEVNGPNKDTVQKVAAYVLANLPPNP
jgi:hypothetical protein